MHCPSGEPTISFSLASHRCAKLSKSHLGIGKAVMPIIFISACRVVIARWYGRSRLFRESSLEDQISCPCSFLSETVASQNDDGLHRV